MSKLKTKPFDPANYLDSEATIAAYLEAAAEGGDAAHFASALGDVARARNMSAIARETGLTRQGLSKALAADGNPSLSTAMRVLSCLGLEISVRPSKTAAIRRKRAAVG
ncbi:addiction module antidote protein [Hyphomicrobium sp. 2TAF46]|uniref:addiction module antidote protein n=1 Tax=Hyphomicrobium sp. 2TAF46 TaxID=3233019 RepID=UPI003F90790C